MTVTATELILLKALTDIVEWANTIPDGWGIYDWITTWHHKAPLSDTCAECTQVWPCAVERGARLIPTVDLHVAGPRSSRDVP